MLKKVHKLIKDNRIVCKPKDILEIKKKIRVCRECDKWNE